jgi:hypothetical protein
MGKIYVADAWDGLSSTARSWAWLAESRPDLVVICFDRDYKLAHGHEPQGVAIWKFRIGTGTGCDGEPVCVGKLMAFQDAVLIAQRYAGSLWREKGFQHIYVVP